MKGFPILCPALLGLLLAAPGCGTGDSPLPPGADLGLYGDMGKPEAYRGPGLYTYMDGGADIFFEYGFTAAWLRRYQRGGRELAVELFEMKDDVAANGIYTYMRRLGTEETIAGGCRGSLTDAQVQISRGRFFLVCRHAGPIADDGGLIRDLCSRLVARLEGTCGEGGLFAGLPKEGRVSGSEVFLAGPVGLNIRPWLAPLERSGFERGWLADYETAGEVAQVLLAEYSSAAEADRAGQDFAGCAPLGCVLLYRNVRLIVAHGPQAREDELRRLAERLLSASIVMPSPQRS